MFGVYIMNVIGSSLRIFIREYATENRRRKDGGGAVEGIRFHNTRKHFRQIFATQRVGFALSRTLSGMHTHKMRLIDVYRRFKRVVIRINPTHVITL